MTSSLRVVSFTLLLASVLVAVVSAVKCPMEERGCQCTTVSGSEQLRSARCIIRPNDSPRNVINAMPRDSTTNILVRAHNASDVVTWELRRSLLSQFKVLSQLEVPYSGLLNVGSASFVDLKTLTLLNLSGNNLRAIIPGTFTESKLLRKLDISKTNLKYLDGFTFRDLNLTFLNVSSNFIIDMHDDVFNDSTVKNLDLSRNNLTEIRLRQLNPLRNNLSVLNLSFNMISNIGARIFQNFRSLKHLDLNHNQILTISDKMFLSTAGSVLSELKTVTIRNNLIRDFPKSFLNVLTPLTALDIDENPLSCNCRLLWLKTSYPNATCETNRTCFQKTKCFRDGIGDLIYNVPSEEFKCAQAEITKIEMDEDSITCTARGDPFPEVWFTEPSGRQIESKSKYVDYDIITTVKLNLRSRIGEYVCHARGYDKKEAVLNSPVFGLCPSRHEYFDTGALVMAVVGTFVGCILVALSVLLWQKCTKIKPRKGRYTAPSMDMAYRMKSEPRPPRRGY